MGRHDTRRHFDEPTRLTLLEGDADEHDIDIADIRREQSAARQVVMGVLVSLVVASIMLAVNVTVMR